MTFSKTRVGLVCLVLVLGCLAHGPMLSASFKTLDDESSIINNPDIRDLANTPKLFRSSFFGGKHYYRPMVSASFMLEYHLFGLRPFFYNLDNLALHLACAAAVFFLVFLILKDSAAAFLASLLFAVHPVQWEAVANIPGRAVLLSTVFTLNALLFFCFYLERRSRAAGRRGSLFYYGVSLLCFAAGLLSKESAAMFPVLAASYLVFVKKDGRAWRLLVPYFMLIPAYLALRYALGLTATYPWRSPGELVLGFSTFLRAVLTFARLFVLPVDLHFDRARAMFTSFGDPQLWATLTVVLAAAALLVRSRRRLSGTTLFFISWFCIELVPVSQIITTIGVCPGYISAAEHFLYMPAVGVFALMAVGGRRLYARALEKNICSPFTPRFAAAGIVLALMLTTARQGYYAQRAFQMFGQTLKYNPDNSRILYSMGLEMARQERYAEAEVYFRRALEREPPHAAARHALGRALFDQRKYIQAVAVYQQVKDAGRGDVLLEENLRAAYPRAIEEYRQWLARQPDNARLHYSLGTVYSRAGETEKAVTYYLQAVALDPDFKEALFNLAASYEGLGQPDMAAVFYERALNRPGGEDYLDAAARARLAEIYGNKGGEGRGE